MSDTTITTSVSHDFALRAVAAAIDEGARRHVAVSVTVVDPALSIVAYARADSTMPHSVETSRRKANTAASTRRPSGWMEGDFATALPLASNGLLTNILGGVPIIIAGVHVGGLGVAGGTPQQDLEIALATLELLGGSS